MRVAIPVKDESLEIFIRTGRAPYFAIFTIEDGRYQFEGLRENEHAKDHAHEEDNGSRHEAHTEKEIEHHRRQMQNLKDCDAVLVRAVGPNMRDALKREGLRVVQFRPKDGDRATDLVEKFMAQINPN